MWTGGGDGFSWNDATNWAHGSGNGLAPPGAGNIACISSFASVEVTGVINVGAVHLDDETSYIDAGEGLFGNGPSISVWGPNTSVSVDQGVLGGSGLIDTHGTVEFLNGSVLASITGAGGTAWGGAAGRLTIASAGTSR